MSAVRRVHLREEDVGLPVVGMAALVQAAAIELPVLQREDEHVGQPDQD